MLNTTFKKTNERNCKFKDFTLPIKHTDWNNCLFFFVTLIRYLTLKLDLNNPILSEELINEITNPVYYKTLFLFSSIMLICVLKYYKKNILVIVLSLIVILATVLVKESTIGWHRVVH